MISVSNCTDEEILILTDVFERLFADIQDQQSWYYSDEYIMTAGGMYEVIHSEAIKRNLVFG